MITSNAIRLAVAADAAAIALMSRHLIEHGLPWGWDGQRVAQAILAPHINVAVTGPRGAPVGFGIMAYHDDDAHLVLFAVQPARQRQGLGKALLDWLEAAARVAGAERIRVEARRENLAARIFYNELGYHERTISKAMYNGQVDGVRLEKWLRVHDVSASGAAS